MTHELHLYISGHVQGVSFRANAANMAQRLGLVGWIGNLKDGRVELLAQGDVKPLKSLLAWAHTGPSQARVDHVEAHWNDLNEVLAEFLIRS